MEGEMNFFNKYLVSYLKELSLSFDCSFHSDFIGTLLTSDNDYHVRIVWSSVM